MVKTQEVDFGTRSRSVQGRAGPILAKCMLRSFSQRFRTGVTTQICKRHFAVFPSFLCLGLPDKHPGSEPDSTSAAGWRKMSPRD